MFQPGRSGNPNGKPKGAENKVTKELRGKITSIVNGQIDKVQTDLELLEPKDRLNILLQLLKFCTPQLKAIEYEASAETNNPFKPIIINVTDESKRN